MADVLREIGTPVVVVGHSLGGRIGVHLAATFPELVRGLLLTGAPLIRTTSATKPKAGYRIARWLNQRGVISDARMEEARKKYGSSDYANASPAMRAVHVKLVNENYDAQIDARARDRSSWCGGATTPPRRWRSRSCCRRTSAIAPGSRSCRASATSRR